MRGGVVYFDSFSLSVVFAFKWDKVNFPYFGPELNAFEIDV